MALRRMKSDKVNGRPLVVLPPKIVTIEQIRMSPEEEAIYKAFEERSQVKFQRYVREGFRANYSHILVSCRSPPFKKFPQWREHGYIPLTVDVSFCEKHDLHMSLPSASLPLSASLEGDLSTTMWAK